MAILSALVSLALLTGACAEVLGLVGADSTVAEPEPPAPVDLPGEPYEFGPGEGTSLAVVGVDYEDALGLRDVPAGETIAALSLGNPIAYLLAVTEVPAGAPAAYFDSWEGAVVATGRTRRLPDSTWPDAVWNEVRVAGHLGWAPAAFLAPLGLTDDITAHIIDRLGGRPTAATLVDLGLLVAEGYASPEPPTRVVVTVGPSLFEGLGEVIVDVVNLPDDSLLGYRLHIFATPAGDWMSEHPGPFTLRSVERTVLCQSHRGTTPEGLCR